MIFVFDQMNKESIFPVYLAFVYPLCDSLYRMRVELQVEEPEHRITNSTSALAYAAYI